MKLLFCPECGDVRKLVKIPDSTHCACGESFGWYLEDGLNVVISGEGLAIGIDDNSIDYAVKERLKGNGRYIYLSAWLVAEDHKLIEFGPRVVERDDD